MACDTANTYKTIELFGLTEKDAQLPIPEDQVLTDSIICALVGAIEVMSEAAGECYEIEMGHAFIPGTGVAHGAALSSFLRDRVLGVSLDRSSLPIMPSNFTF